MQNIKVWDLFIRFFHWSLVFLFLLSYVTEDFNDIHIIAGYGVFTLILMRVFWGIAGSQYARFSNFIYAPSEVLQYLKSLFNGQPKHYLGHNPAGGMMVIMLLLGLIMTTLSGIKLQAIESGEGLLAQTPHWTLISTAHADSDHYEYDDDDDHYGYEKENEADEFWEEIHEVSTHLTIFMIFIHIMGVYFSSQIHGESLIKAMWTGFKQKHQEPKNQ